MIKETGLKKLLISVKKDISDEYFKYFGVWKEQIIDFIDYEKEFEIKTLSNLIATHDFKLPSKTQLNSAVFMTPMHSIEGADKGKLLSNFYKDWTNNAVKRTTGIIKAGYYQGLTNQEIIKQVKGTARLKFADGQLARGNRDIESVVRTMVQHASNQARNETWKANDDIIEGIEIVATLDSVTTVICRSLDGKVYSLDSGPRPPFSYKMSNHNNCEINFCFLMYLTKEVRELQRIMIL